MRTLLDSFLKKSSVPLAGIRSRNFGSVDSVALWPILCGTTECLSALEQLVAIDLGQKCLHFVAHLLFCKVGLPVEVEPHSVGRGCGVREVKKFKNIFSDIARCFHDVIEK